jgi:signal transduction histidine kinase
VSLGTDVLLLLTVLTTALLGRNWGWYAVAACEAAVLLIAVGVTSGAVTFTIDIEEYALAPSTWLFSTIVILFIMAVAVKILGSIHDALLTSIASLRDQASELAKAHAESETAHRSKSAFMANVSHEFRTPLNAIVGYADLLQKKISDEKQKKELATIAASGRGLALLVDSILDLSRLEAGDTQLDVGATDIRTLIAALVPRYEQGATQKGLSFSWNVEGVFRKQSNSIGSGSPRHWATLPTTPSSSQRPVIS